MRISTQQLQFESVNRMLEQQAKLNYTQQQISTGRKILTPADDPAGSAKVMGVSQVVSVTEQYLRNSDVASSRLETEQATLDSVMNLYQRAREISVQGLNDTQGPAGRKSIALELQGLLDELKSLANKKDASGEYVFSGFSANNAPVADNGSGTYTYQGDQGTRLLRIGPSRDIAGGDTGFDVFFDIPGISSPGSNNAFKTIYTAINDLNANAPSTTTLQDFDAIMNNISNVRAKIGSRLNSIDDQRQVNDAVILQNKTLQSQTEDLDFAEAITRLNLQSTGLQAAQQSYIKVQGLSLFNFL